MEEEKLLIYEGLTDVNHAEVCVFKYPNIIKLFPRKWSWSSRRIEASRFKVFSDIEQVAKGRIFSNVYTIRKPMTGLIVSEVITWDKLFPSLRLFGSEKLFRTSIQIVFVGAKQDAEII